MSAYQEAVPSTVLTAPKPQRPTMTLEEVVEYTGLCRATVYKWAASNRGGFPSQRSLGPRRSNGRSARSVWLRADIEAWLAAQFS
jgi:predicted DNA-binding transcriptional regulator AlpA